MEQTSIRIFLFFLILLSGFSGPLWVFVGLVIAYIFLYFGIELIVVAAAIDGYFGYTDGGLFIYTLSVAGALFLAQCLKPYLSVYNQ